MKHIKSYNIFESNSLSLGEINSFISEHLAHLLDNGFEVYVPDISDLTDTYTPYIDIDITCNNFFYWNDVSDSVLSLIDYIKDWGIYAVYLFYDGYLTDKLDGDKIDSLLSGEFIPGQSDDSVAKGIIGYDISVKMQEVRITIRRPSSL